MGLFANSPIAEKGKTESEEVTIWLIYEGVWESLVSSHPVIIRANLFPPYRMPSGAPDAAIPSL